MVLQQPREMMNDQLPEPDRASDDRIDGRTRPMPVTDPRTVARHPRKPWLPVASKPKQPLRAAFRTFCTPVVRELPQRREYGAPGVW